MFLSSGDGGQVWRNDFRSCFGRNVSSLNGRRFNLILDERNRVMKSLGRNECGRISLSFLTDFVW